MLRNRGDGVGGDARETAEFDNREAALDEPFSDGCGGAPEEPGGVRDREEMGAHV
jgi:hypothetical protein